MKDSLGNELSLIHWFRGCGLCVLSCPVKLDIEISLTVIDETTPREDSNINNEINKCYICRWYQHNRLNLACLTSFLGCYHCQVLALLLEYCNFYYRWWFCWDLATFVLIESLIKVMLITVWLDWMLFDVWKTNKALHKRRKSWESVQKIEFLVN